MVPVPFYFDSFSSGDPLAQVDHSHSSLSENYQYRASRIFQMVDVPRRPMEEEREKNSNRSNNNNNNSSDDDSTSSPPFYKAIPLPQRNNTDQVRALYHLHPCLRKQQILRGIHHKSPSQVSSTHASAGREVDKTAHGLPAYVMSS